MLPEEIVQIESRGSRHFSRDASILARYLIEGVRALASRSPGRRSSKEHRHGNIGQAEEAWRRADTQPCPAKWSMQGGGALGAYQVGVYQALHERDRAGLGHRDVDRRHQRGADRRQPPERRLEALHEFWGRVGQRAGASGFGGLPPGDSVGPLDDHDHGLAPFSVPTPSRVRSPSAGRSWKTRRITRRHRSVRRSPSSSTSTISTTARRA